MEGRSFDRLARSVASSGSRRQVLGALLAGALGGLRIRTAAADDDGPDIASAGNGGVATASANGGAVAIGDVNSGGNAGNAIGVGDTVGSVAADGGDAANSTGITVTGDGGTGIADASGGDDNLAAVVDPAPARNDRDREPERDDDDEDEDKDKNKDKGGEEPVEEPVCPPETATFCCQCFEFGTDTPVGCNLTADTEEACASFCDANLGDAPVLTAGPGQGYTCDVGDPPTTCTLFTC